MYNGRVPSDAMTKAKAQEEILLIVIALLLTLLLITSLVYAKPLVVELNPFETVLVVCLDSEPRTQVISGHIEIMCLPEPENKVYLPFIQND